MNNSNEFATKLHGIFTRRELLATAKRNFVPATGVLAILAMVASVLLRWIR